MAGELSTKFYEVLQTHLDSGVPVEELHLSQEQAERIKICLEVYKYLEERDPFADVSAILRNRYHRTAAQICADKKVVHYIVSQLNSNTKEMSRYRALKGIEKSMRMGDQAGDAKILLEASKSLIKLEGLDKPESIMDDLHQSVHALPPVFTTDVTKINSDLTNFTDEQREKLLKKYHVEKDKTQEMVEAKMGIFVPAGSMVAMADYEEVEEDDNVFAEFDANDSF